MSYDDSDAAVSKAWAARTAEPVASITAYLSVYSAEQGDYVDVSLAFDGLFVQIG